MDIGLSSFENTLCASTPLGVQNPYQIDLPFRFLSLRGFIAIGLRLCRWVLAVA